MKNLLVLLLTVCSQGVLAEQTITWQELMPVNVEYQDISASHKALLTEIYVYEVAQQTRQLSPMEEDGYNQRVALAEKFGLDVRTLLEQRARIERETNGVVSDFSVNEMRIGGYLVPLEMEGVLGTQFVLVPTAGACIHTPPPPVNQTILVEFPQGYELQSLYTPVWVKGDIQAESITTSVALSDGNQQINAGYSIDASNIELYK